MVAKPIIVKASAWCRGSEPIDWQFTKLEQQCGALKSQARQVNQGLTRRFSITL